MTKCFGIISWLPDQEPARSQREDRLNRLLQQLEVLWPNIDILCITQNWKDFKPKETLNKLIRIDFKSGFGILKARKTLRKEFLKLNYDYIIMFDDDAIIQCDTNTAAAEYMAEVDKHKVGFCFMHTKGYKNAKGNRPDTYVGAQLNLCAISKDIYAKEDIPDIDPQKGQGFEDHCYSILLHAKYSAVEFYPPETLRCIQFENRSEVAPSTWADAQLKNFSDMNRNTDKVIAYIVQHKDIPNLELFWKYDILVSKTTKEANLDAGRKIPRRKPDNSKLADGKNNTYLYF